MWWENIDRDEAIAECVSAATGGGCVVLIGSDEDGPQEATSMVQSALGERAIDYHLVDVTLTAPTKKSHLLAIWKALKPATDGAIPPWAVYSDSDPGTVLREMVADLQELEGEAAVILPFVDRYRTPEPFEASRFAEVARETGLGVILTAVNPEPWRLTTHLTTIELRPFDRNDIEQCVTRRSAERWMSQGEIQALVDKVMAAANSEGVVLPLDAYTILEQEGAA